MAAKRSKGRRVGGAFAVALEQGLATRALGDALRGLELASVADVRALLDAIPRFPASDEARWRPVAVIAILLQGLGRGELRDEAGEGIDAVHAHYDRALAAERLLPPDEQRLSDFMLLHRVYAVWASRGGLERVLAAARDPLFEDEFLWSEIVDLYAKEEHPLRDDALARLGDPLPAGFVAVALLDASNAAARLGQLAAHPFDSAEGVATLARWLRDVDPRVASYAQSAAAALPFVGAAERAALFEIARVHPAMSVRLEAAWADVVTGGAAGLDVLVGACLDPHHAPQAIAYLEELDQADAIPEAARAPDFTAMAEMSKWLQHPSELGHVPDALELYDTRVLDWPPTDDRRRVWLFRYVDGDDVGIGMVGSVTFALFGEVTDGLPPEDVYALHCCWELAFRDDPRAPDERSVEAGRRLLGLPPR